MKCFYICFLILMLFSSCGEEQTEQLLLSFEFEHKEDKKRLTQRVQELFLTDMEVLTDTDYEWEIMFSPVFNEYSAQRLFENENSFTIYPLDFWEEHEVNAPHLASLGLFTMPSEDDGLTQLRGCYPNPNSELMEALNHYKSDYQSSELLFFLDTTNNFFSPGAGTVVVSSKENAIELGDYITAFSLHSESYEGEVVSVQCVNFKFGSNGKQLLQEVTKENAGYYLAMVCNNHLVSIPRVNSEISEGALEISGDSIFENILQSLLLYDLSEVTMTIGFTSAHFGSAQ